MKKQLKNSYRRSGDHYLLPVKEMIAGEAIKHNGKFVFGVGEASNHNHTIVMERAEDLTIKRDKNGDYYFELLADGQLMHVEGESLKVADHRTIPIRKGIYRQVHEREVDIFSQVVRKVVD